MKNFSKELKKHAKEMIKHKKVKMMSLASKKNKSYQEKKSVIYTKRDLVPIATIKNPTNYEITLTTLVNIGALLKKSVT